MGKKRIATKEDKPKAVGDEGQISISKKRADVGALHIQSTFNNTKVLLTDTKGNALAWGSSGNLGFKSPKKYKKSIRV